jgi:hypothetical protein
MGEKRNSIEDRINDLDHRLRGMEDEVKNKAAVLQIAPGQAWASLAGLPV